MGTFERFAESEDSACSNSEKFMFFPHFSAEFPALNVVEPRNRIYGFPERKNKIQRRSSRRFLNGTFLFDKHSISFITAMSHVKMPANQHVRIVRSHCLK